MLQHTKRLRKVCRMAIPYGATRSYIKSQFERLPARLVAREIKVVRKLCSLS